MTFQRCRLCETSCNYSTPRHCPASALPRSRFTATVLIAFEICSFQNELAISIASLVLLLWILYCLIKIFTYLAGKHIDCLAHRLSHTLSQICREHFKTGLETTKIKSNPHHYSLSTAWNQREQQQCQHFYSINTIQSAMFWSLYNSKYAQGCALEKQLLFSHVYCKVWCLICCLHLFYI